MFYTIGFTPIFKINTFNISKSYNIYYTISWILININKINIDNDK